MGAGNLERKGPNMVEMRQQPANEDWRDVAVETRDRAADGRFWFGVVTTGIYCRPSCAARTALRENRRWFENPDAAEAAGFRACLKCRPREAVDDPIARVCRMIEAGDSLPSLDDMAAAAGLSSFHFHRRFKAETGLTPRAYAAGVRAGRLQAGLTDGASVTEAIHGAGYDSAARAYAESEGRLGMAPHRVRARGVGEHIRAAVAMTSLGCLLVAATDVGVVRIAFGSEPELMDGLRRDFARAEISVGDVGFSATVSQVVALVEEPARAQALPLDIRGTAFQQRVWAALRRIPAGATASYSEIAAAIGQPRAVRAVASACAANDLLLAIPCHRVVPAAGGTGGYRGGAKRKAALLDREKLLY